MRAAFAGFTALLVACEPPPEVAGSGEPRITIAWPLADVGEIATTCDGTLEMLVVVDIDALTLQDPYVEGVEAVDGQGHWHVTIGGSEGYTPSFTRSVQVVEPEVAPGFSVITVTLQDNLHEDLVGPGVQDAVEFQIVEPPAEECP